MADAEFLQLEGLHADGSDLGQGIGAHHACATVEEKDVSLGRLGMRGCWGIGIRVEKQGMCQC